jgi:RHS repeat-associated protein
MDFYPTTVQELIDAINTANGNSQADNIYLVANGTYTLTAVNNTGTNNSNGFPLITSEIAIYGNGATIQRDAAAPDFRFFELTSAGVLTLSNVQMSDGKLTGTSHPSKRGGVVYNPGGVISLVDSNFSDNAVIDEGGVVYAYQGQVDIQNCTFQNNSGQGGAIYNHSTDTLITDSTFYNNQSPWDDGGAIQTFYHSSFQVEGCTFDGNASNGDGGAIRCGHGPLDLKDCVFQNNTANNGGAIFHRFGTLSVEKATFSENTATEDYFGGGAIFWHSEDPLMVVDSIFSGNSAQTGAAIFAAHNGAVTLNYNLFLNNTNRDEIYGYGYSLDGFYSIRADATNNWWGAVDGPRGFGSGSGDSIGDYVDYLPYLGVGPSPQEGGASCPCTHTGNDSPTTHNPISLRLAEVRFQAVDLSLTTPAGTLSFTRTYRQGEQAAYQFMGLGWNHNHAIRLKDNLPDPNEIIVELDTGKAHFSYDFTDTEGVAHYKALSGSTSLIEKDTVGYGLTAADKSVYTFDTDGKLLTRAWPNNEVWSYSYSGDQLIEVADGYGRSLNFAYHADHTGDDAYKNGQLWRVGDHTTTDLETTPSGRYVEFDYAPEQSDGIPVGTGALLTSVRDVYGSIWIYRYYGQNSGETDSNLLNLLIERLSPAVDVDGDGSPDTPVSLEQLSYTFTSGALATIIQARGDGALTTTLEFAADLTSETVAGKTTQHHFENGVYTGSEDAAGNLNSETMDSGYRPALRQDANGNSTRLAWSVDSKYLNKVTDALNQQTNFSYNSDDTLAYSLDAQGRKTEYAYGTSNPRLPIQIKVWDADGTTVLHWQEFVYDSQGRTTEENTYHPSDGTTLLNQVTRTYGTSGNENGLLVSLTQIDLLDSANNVSTTYTYDSVGRVIKTQKSSLFGSCQVAYTVYDDAGNVVASLCNYQNAGADPTTAAEAAALYDLSTPEVNRVTTSIYDPLGRRIQTVIHAGVDANAANAQTTLTVYDALDRVIRTISNYVADSSIPNPYTVAHSAFAHGTDNTQNLVTDTAYNARGRVRAQTDLLGNVTLYGYDDANRLVKTVQSASQPGYNNDYSGTAPDPSLASYSPSSSADQDLVTTQAYDANGNLVQTVDALGSISYTVYDALNRSVKTVRSAKDAATLSLNPGDTGYDATNDPRSSAYAPSIDPDRDLIATTEYDALGRVIRTQQFMENRPAEIWDTTFYGYDALGRPIKVVRSASDPSYDLSADPDLSGYSPSANADQDLITTTTYDVQGRMLFTEDVLGAQTRLVYDGLNRQVMTIANFVDQGEDPALWVWSSPNSRWQTSTGTAIDYGVQNDQNLIQATSYDSDGNVQESRDGLGRVTHYVYDPSNRLVRTVTNYVPQGSSDPGAWVWDDGWKQSGAVGAPAVSTGTDNDQNQVASTVYDTLGRVAQTIDTRHNVTLALYDVLGRRVTTIPNYVAQGTSDPAAWVWNNSRWEDGASNAISFGADADQNRIVTSTYDLAGRVATSRDPAGVDTRFAYDALGRRTQTTVNYGDGVFNPASPDEDLISSTTYNQGGQVLSTTDARATQTAFTYDAAGRRLTVTQAAGSSLATTNYTCYDKAGRTLRTMAHWSNDPTQPTPDARDSETGAWLFVPAHHGAYNDRDLIRLYSYDLASRQVTSADPLGNTSSTTYFKDGSVASVTDPLSVVTAYRYDGLRRRSRVVQNFVHPGEDPALWVWNTGWKKSDGTTAISNGAANDQNVIVDLTLDIAGRVVSQREPGGHVTTYAYDQLNRRKSLTNSLSQVWTTAYADLTSGQTQTTLTLPGITGATNYQVQRQFDRLGRATTIAYGDPTSTPDVTFSYDAAGNRAAMSEFSAASFTNRIRATNFGYDALHRLTSVGFDNNGDGTVDQTVSYQYDAGGLRTQLTLPGGLNVVYTYDQRGQLISLTDWDSQPTTFAYDHVGRHIAAVRANGLRSRYEYDAAGRLLRLRHATPSKTLAQFVYTVDARGHRIQAQETIAHPATSNDVTLAYDDKSMVTVGTWANVSSFKQSTDIRASLLVGFFGDSATLTMGTGPDHSLYDVYLDGSLWQSFDGYAASAGQTDILVTLGVDSRKLTTEGLHILEIRNRAEHQSQSTGDKVRFKQLLIADEEYDFQTISYSYDALARLTEARYAPGLNVAAVDADLLRRYQYSYDLSGNRTQQIATIAGTPTTSNYSYNAANQLTSDGSHTLTYDANGSLTSDGVHSYTWDRANRMLSMGSASYAYDGAGNRIAQTVSATVTNYLLDLQPGLVNVLAATTGANTTRSVHAPRGVLAQKDSSGNWEWLIPDGLGSIRGVTDNVVTPLEYRLYEPYGELYSGAMSQTPYGFTGEWRDATTDLTYLRARYYAPGLGVFTAQDAFENDNRYSYASGDPINGAVGELLSLNGYAYVNGNPVNLVDPSGMCAQPTQWWNPVDANCYYSADGLARRFSNGDPNAYQALFDVLIQKNWGDLKVIEGWGSAAGVTGSLNQFMKNSSILPALLVRHPRLALQALQQWGCQNNINLGLLFPVIDESGTATLTGEVVVGGATASGAEAAGGSAVSNPLGLAIAGGVGLGFLIALLFAGTTDDTQKNDENADCDPNCVVRGGIAAKGSFTSGYTLRRLPPLIHGFSVQYRPGVLLKDLAQAGLPNKQLSYARDTEVIAVGAALGYVVSIPITTGLGPYHATVTVNDTDGNNVPDPLPDELDTAFVAAFWRKMPNPNPS